jgi:hypothetical protein
MAGLVIAGVLVWGLAASAAETKGGPAGAAGETKLSDEYVRMVGQAATFWAWPMVNVFNRRLGFKDVQEPGLIGGIIPCAPLNHNCMLGDYIAPQERAVACPNQDVVYGVCVLALDESPVVVQVPDFGKRFWVYQVVDLRTDSFVELGAMYGTPPGFYLLVGPTWQGKPPAGIQRVFRAKTGTGFVIPRVFRQDTPEDLAAVQGVLRQVLLYPLAEFDGKMKSKDWSKLPSYPEQTEGKGEMSWVFPEKLFAELPMVLEQAPPRPGEEALYAQILSVLQAAKKDRHIMEVLTQAAVDADRQIVTPLLQFRNWGEQLPAHWSTIGNGAAFGTDYFTRTAVAKSNIFVNAPSETKYFYQDLDEQGGRLNGASRYTLTFPPGQTPPVEGFWSLTLYDEYHFFAPNELNRYSIGTKSPDLKRGAGGSLTLYVQADPPSGEMRSNWLPAPKGDFSLYLRAYWPKAEILDGKWTPPPVIRSASHP